MINPPHLGGLAESRYSNGSFIIRYSKLRELLSPKVKLMSKQGRYFCECEFFILRTSLQGSLSKCIAIETYHLS